MIAKRVLLAVTATLAASVLALVGLAVADNTAQAQANSLQPSNVQVVNGPNAGEAVVSWNAVTGAAYYRVGWVSVTNYLAVTDAGRDWQEAFYFVDLKNSGQTSFTISRLEPGVLHVFRVAGNSSQYGEPQWSDFQWLTLNSDTTSCPTPTPAPGTTPTPTPGATTTATPPPAVTGGDYDADDDGLIEIRSIAQLDAIRHDLDGDGVADDAKNDAAAYAAAFPSAATGMGCRGRCTGYELANDLDFGTAAVGFGWAPIGYYRGSYSNAGFSATFEGNGRTVSNLFINRGGADNVGLFGYIGSGGVVRGVGLRSVYVVGSAKVGGLVGRNHGIVNASNATGTVSGVYSHVGGLVGINYGTITASYATGTVSSGSHSYGVGGLVGYNGGTITASYATGTVSSIGDYVGGLVGYNDGAITASYATGTVSSSEDEVGGLVGWNGGAITASYATGTVSGRYRVGGLVGDGGNAQFSFWDTETSGLTSSSGGAGKTTAELQSPTVNTGIYARWDPNWWDFGTSSQYPVLKVDGLSVAAQRGQATADSKGNAADRDALVALYQATGGAGWTEKTNWLGDKPLDEWEGVDTNADGRVTGLELPGNNLNNGKAGGHHKLTMLGDLNGLTRLDLANNDLGGALPPELDLLANLTHLDLSRNAFRGDISNQNPDHDRGIDWQNLSKLAHLNLSWNKRCGALGCRHGLSGWIPVAFTIDTHDFFPNLVYLDLSGNELNGGAQALLEKSYTSPDATDEPIIVKLSDNPWAYEPAENRDYWNKFEGEIMRGFVDLTKLSVQQKYGIPSPDPDSLKNYAAAKGIEKIEVRAVRHVAQSGKYAKSATWLIRGAKVVVGAGTGVGWVVFSLDVANTLNQMINAGIDFLEAGPGAMIEKTSDRVLGTWWSCALANGLENASEAEIIAVCGEW